MLMYGLACRWVSICFLLLFSSFLQASTASAGWPVPFQAEHSYSLTPFSQSLTLGHQVRYRVAEVRSADELRGLPQDGWTESEPDTISLGFQTEPHWFVVDVQVRENIPRYWILELGNALIDQVSVYVYQSGHLVQHWATGDALPFRERPLESARFLFPVELQDNEQYQFYLRVESTEALELPLTLTERSAHAVMSDRRSLVDGIFHGFMIIMAAYSLAIYVILKDKSYLYYACYVTAMLMFFLSQQGLLYQYLFPTVPLAQHYVIPWVSILIFASIALFFRSFLSFNVQSPIIWMLYKILLSIHGVLCIALLVAQYQVVVSLMALNVALSMMLAVMAIVQLSRGGSRPAQIVLAGWGMLFVFILLFVFARTGIFYNDFLANYGLRIGVSLEILIFSFALSFRINQERQEKEWALNKINFERAERIQAQALALDREVEARQAREQSLQMEITHRESLERLVEERTADLERTLQDLEKANGELEQLSSKDALTGLFNRRMFDLRLLEFWSDLRDGGKLLSLLVIDVDHFKQINDSKGHLCGDMVLRELAHVLRSVLHRPTDVITRYGGEEFAVLLPDTPSTGAAHVAELIIQAAADKVYVWERESLRVTVSVGVHTLVPDPSISEHELVEGADQALYQAKREGRNRLAVFQPPSAEARSVGG